MMESVVNLLYENRYGSGPTMMDTQPRRTKLHLQDTGRQKNCKILNLSYGIRSWN